MAHKARDKLLICAKAWIESRCLLGAAGADRWTDKTKESETIQAERLHAPVAALQGSVPNTWPDLWFLHWSKMIILHVNTLIKVYTCRQYKSSDFSTYRCKNIVNICILPKSGHLDPYPYAPCVQVTVVHWKIRRGRERESKAKSQFLS